nr:MAG TPA: encapsulin [Caudoviricetes sp.]
MAIFANPYTGDLKDLNNRTELLQALEIELAGELEAIFIYRGHLERLSENDWIYKVISDIMEEEKLHAEELQYCIERLQKEGRKKRTQAIDEVQGFIEESMRENAERLESEEKDG